MIRLLFLWSLWVALCFGVSLGTYNVENLFDGKYQGGEYEEFIPGKFGWDEAMAAQKFTNTLAVIRALDVDILTLQEVENAALVQRIGQALAYPYFAFAKPDNVATGVAVLSRYPIVQTQTLPLTGGRFREMLWVGLDVEGMPLELVAVHWPSLRNPATHRLNAAKRLKDFVKGRDKVILLGDFNDPLGKESVLSQVFGRLEVRQGWFDPWFTRQERWSYDFFGKKQVLDRIILSQGLLEGEGLVYEWGSFEVFSRPFFSTKNGSPYRWERRNRGKGEHVGKGYSDHFPLRLKLTTSPKLKLPLPVGIDALFEAKDGSVNVLLPEAVVMYVHEDGFVLGAEGRGIYVHKPDFTPQLGEVLRVWVHGVKTFHGMREISALHVEDILPQKGDIYATMLPQSALKQARAGDVMRSVEGVVKQGNLITREGSIKLHAKNKANLPKEGQKVRLERVRVGMYGGRKELIIEERE